jgi:hypothetical protein
MSALATSLIICAILIGGALAGSLLRHLLPEHHLDVHAKDIVRLGCALIATIAGLLLGLLINSAKNNLETQRNEIRLLTANVIVLDHLLEQYGAETLPIRTKLRSFVREAVDRIWGDVRPSKRPFRATAAGAAAEQAIRSLVPATDPQRLYQSDAIQTLDAILKARALLFEQSNAHMPNPFLMVLVFWLFILFVSFSLFSPLNPTALGAIAVIALSASAAVFLILEMYEPFRGIMQIPSEPLRLALRPLAS